MLLIYKLATVIVKSYQFVVIAFLTRVFDCADSVSFEHHWLVSILKWFLNITFIKRRARRVLLDVYGGQRPVYDTRSAARAGSAAQHYVSSRCSVTLWEHRAVPGQRSARHWRSMLGLASPALLTSVSATITEQKDRARSTITPSQPAVY